MRYRERELLLDLLNYMFYLKTNKKYYSWNKGYFKKLEKKLDLFVEEYSKNNFE